MFYVAILSSTLEGSKWITGDHQTIANFSTLRNNIVPLVFNWFSESDKTSEFRFYFRKPAFD